MFQSYYRDLNIPDGNCKNENVALQLNCVGYNHFAGKAAFQSIRQDYYLFYLHEGEYLLREPITATLKAGQFIIYDTDVSFSYYKNIKSYASHYFAHFTGYAAAQLISRCGIDVNTIYPIDKQEPLIQCFQSLFQCFHIRDTMFDLDCAQKLTALLLTLGRDITAKKADQSRFSVRSLEQTLQYIHENYTTDISVEALAKMEFLSISRFRELFTSQTGQSPGNYIIKLRIQTAGELLTTTNLSIQQISQAVGYSDQQYFSRLFRRYTGYSPSEYRRIR